jgi:hypothetical protein
VVNRGGFTVTETDRDPVQQGDNVIEETVSDVMLGIKHDFLRSESDGLYEAEFSAGRPMQGGVSVSMNQSDLNCLSDIKMTDERPSNQDSLEDDSMQTKKWADLIRQGVEEHSVEGIDLLRAMEQSVDEEFLDQETEGSEILSKEVVENISKARENMLCMELCDKKKSKELAWGPVLVERKRRGHNHGASMLQKAIELKKKKDLEPVKGNKFAALQYDELNQISNDIDVKIVQDKSDSINIIDDMIESENKRCE